MAEMGWSPERIIAPGVNAELPKCGEVETMDKKVFFAAAAVVVALSLGLVLVPTASSAPTITIRPIMAFDWHAGDDFLAEFDPSFSPAVARAAVNGDTVEIKAGGTLSVFPKMATGGGTFVHKAADGTVRAAGDITVLGLIMFHSYGNQPDLPPTFEGGQALIRVHLQPAAGGPGFTGILWVDCAIGKFPPGHPEGVRLLVQDVINFNKKVSGNTLFIRTG